MGLQGGMPWGRSPALLLTATPFALSSKVPVIVSEPPTFFTSGATIPSRRRRFCDAAERSRPSPESVSEPPSPTDANDSSALTTILARLQARELLQVGASELSEMVTFLLPISMGAVALYPVSGSSSITKTASSSPALLSRSSNRSSPGGRAMWPGISGGRAGGLPGGASGVTCGGDDGGEIVSPPPHAQHMTIESKPAMSKVPHV